MEEIKLPELGENVETVEVSAVLVAVGDRIRSDQPVIEVETEKASLEVPATCAGRVEEVLIAPGDLVKVGQALLRVASEDTRERETPVPLPRDRETPAPVRPDREAVARKAPPAEPESPVPVTPHRPRIGETVPAAPSVRRLAREMGVEIVGVSGTGPGGRISRDDVKAHARSVILRAAGRPDGPAGRAEPDLPDFSRWGEVEREPMSNVRRATASAVSTAWSIIPHVTQFDRADITQLEALRKKYNARPEAAARKLSLTAIVVKMVAAALRRFPRFNASLDLAGEAVILKKYVHVGVAVDTDRGLLVPAIRDADRKSLVEVARELTEIAGRARDKKITLEEMRGATFTVSNLGGLGTTYFSPIVNWPQVAILGVGRAETQAVFEDRQFQPRLILPLSLSYDHRLIDGADAARFLRWLAEALEQPLLLLEG